MQRLPSNDWGAREASLRLASAFTLLPGSMWIFVLFKRPSILKLLCLLCLVPLKSWAIAMAFLMISSSLIRRSFDAQSLCAQFLQVTVKWENRTTGSSSILQLMKLRLKEIRNCLISPNYLELPVFGVYLYEILTQKCILGLSNLLNSNWNSVWRVTLKL